MEQPTQIGRYQVVGHLASGGMAEILLAKLIGPRGFERPVVIKRILPNLVDNAGFLEMFLDEARVVSRINHPNVVAVNELGTHDEALFMVMEYLHGETALGLVRRLKRRERRLGFALAAYIVEQSCAGLHAAHELRSESGDPLGLVHRDISPGNILVTYDGAVKVLDFGIAKFDERETKTEAGLLKGKFAYMSPEQCLSQPLDRRSDVFALGILLWELSVGHRLFSRSNGLLTMKAITDGEVPLPSRYVPDYPDSLARICARALRPSAEERYATAEAMRVDLLHAMRELGAQALPEASLSALMKELFEDRIETKDEMLRRVREGDDLTSLPAAEVDVSIELPTVASAADQTPLGPAALEKKRRVPVGVWVAAGVLLTALGGLSAGAALSNAEDPEPLPTATLPSATPSAPAPPREPEVEPAAPEPATPVTLSVVSAPVGAEVWVDGVSRGPAPQAVEVPSSDTPVRVRVTHPRHDAFETTVIPTADRSIDARLARRASPRPRPARPDPPASSSSPFRRFN